MGFKNLKTYFWGTLLLSGVLACKSVQKSTGYVSTTTNSYYLDFKTNKDLHHFYQLGKENMPLLIQGHRGTREDGLPENSIATMEYVLERMPAVFEIDPRLTKDSVIVVFHDATLDRASNGTGKVSDYTWTELQQMKLKNKSGELTNERIPALGDMLDWARGKTVLILDKKDVPLDMLTAIIRKHNASTYVITQVRSTDDALYYYKENPERMFSASIRTAETFHSYLDAGIPASQMFACIGTELSDSTAQFVQLLTQHGVRALLATSSSYDKLPNAEARAAAYKKILDAGVSIIESDYPLEVKGILTKYFVNPLVVEIATQSKSIN